MPATKYDETRDLRSALNAADVQCIRIYSSMRKDGTVRAKAYGLHKRGLRKGLAEDVLRCLPSGYNAQVRNDQWHGLTSIVITKEK